MLLSAVLTAPLVGFRFHSSHFSLVLWPSFVHLPPSSSFVIFRIRLMARWSKLFFIIIIIIIIIIITVLFHLDCCNRNIMDWRTYQQQKHLFQSSGGKEVEDQVSWFIDHSLFPVSSVGEGTKNSLGPLWGFHHYNLKISQRLHFLISPHWRLGLPDMNLELSWVLSGWMLDARCWC